MNFGVKTQAFSTVISGYIYSSISLMFLQCVVCFAGFSKQTVDLVKEYNQQFGETQSIVLFQPGIEHIGKNLMANIERHLDISTSSTAPASLKYNVKMWQVKRVSSPPQPGQQAPKGTKSRKHTLDSYLASSKKPKVESKVT
jgi:hypothetical protein